VVEVEKVKVQVVGAEDGDRQKNRVKRWSRSK
jgi:hypothetical protein